MQKKKEMVRFKLLRWNKLIELLEIIVHYRISGDEVKKFEKAIGESRNQLDRLTRKYEKIADNNIRSIDAVGEKTQDRIYEIKDMIVIADSIARNNEH